MGHTRLLHDCHDSVCYRLHDCHDSVSLIRLYKSNWATLLYQLGRGRLGAGHTISEFDGTQPFLRAEASFGHHLRHVSIAFCVKPSASSSETYTERQKHTTQPQLLPLKRPTAQERRPELHLSCAPAGTSCGHVSGQVPVSCQVPQACSNSPHLRLGGCQSLGTCPHGLRSAAATHWSGAPLP